MISGAEFERRIRRASQLRAVGICLRRAAWEAYRAGAIPFRPAYDVRSDVAYWRERYAESLSSKPDQRNRER